MADPLLRIIPPDTLISMGRDQVARHLLRAAPDVHTLLRGVVATVLTDPRASSDAALILADHLRAAHDIGGGLAGDQSGLVALIDILTEAAPYMLGGARRHP